MQDDLIPFIPFEKLRGRTLVWCYLITTFVCSMILFELRGAWSKNGRNPLPDAVVGILLYVIFLICISPVLFRSRLSYKQLFGVYPTWSTLRRYTLWAFPLVIFSFVVFYLQYVSLHRLIPELADWWFINLPIPIAIPQGDGTTLVNVLKFSTVVLIAPIVEEFFVRGILLTRWSIKWGTPKAILASSLLFGMLHTDVVGAFFFGYVLSILYIRTKSLYIPICIHMACNLIAWAIAIVPMPPHESPSHETPIVLQESESLWLMAAAVIIIPWVINFVWKNIPKNSWRVPYLLETQFLK